jgi:hypothetical protein
MKFKAILLAIILLTVILTADAKILPVQSTPETKLYPKPQKITANSGETFQIEIFVENVRYLYAWQVFINWTAQILEVVDVQEGPFLSRDGVYKTAFVNYTYNDVGSLLMYDSLRAEPPANSATGSGTLAIIKFRVKALGGSPIDLWNTIMINGYTDKHIPHEVIDGYFQNPVSKLHFEPPSMLVPAVKINQTVQINLTITNAVNLHAAELNVTWDTTVINAINIEEGPFLSENRANPTSFKSQINNDKGYLYINTTILVETAVNGNGTIATITFNITGAGITPLHFSYAKLTDPKGFEIYYTLQDGSFSNLPTMIVEPSSIINPTLTIGSTFTVHVKLIQIEELYAWTVNITWDPTILEVTRIDEGDLLSQWGAYRTKFNSEPNNQQGYALVNCTLEGEPPTAAANGTGILFYITFKVKGGGETQFRLKDTKLFNYYNEELQHLTENGYFNNIYHDIAVIQINFSNTQVTAGEMVTINVTVKNNGTIPESSLILQVYCNFTSIGEATITTLEAAQSTVVTFTWNTSGAALGKYNVKAKVTPLLNEENVQNNELLITKAIEIKEATSGGSWSIPFEATTTVIAITAIIIVIAVALILRRRRH